MKRSILILGFYLPLFLFGQETGVHFIAGSPWNELLARARAEQKILFVDCYTSWCVPCRQMKAQTFTRQDVGDFMNAHFLAVEVQLDSTDTDSKEVRDWYATAHDLANTYNVFAYPSYLFFDGNGKLLHRFGGAISAQAFLKNAKNALQPETQYYPSLEAYQAGRRDTAFLRQLAYLAQSAMDNEMATRLSKEYLRTQTNLYSKANLEFVKAFTFRSSDTGFAILRAQPAKADAVLGKGAAESLIVTVILYEELFSTLFGPGKSPDWNKLQADLSKKYRAEAPEVINKAQILYYQNKQEWGPFRTAVNRYQAKYPDHAAPWELNRYAFGVFQNCSDAASLRDALKWSKSSLKEKNDPSFIDTYANILYKLGEKSQALAWQQKAISYASPEEKTRYQETLDKMKKGEKTWD